DPLLEGSPLTYTITVTNNGPSTATGVRLTDALPAATTFVSATPTLGSCTGTSTVSCNIGTLANGASATVTIVVIPTIAGSISNTATVTSGTTDNTTSNNSATATTRVNAFQRITISGQKFNDSDADSVKDPGEVGLADW